MLSKMIFFVIGLDRPGIVKDVTQYLTERNANIEDSRMAVMGGQFTITCLCTCSPEEERSIRDDIRQLEGVGLSASVYDVRQTDSKPRRAALPLRFEITAMDHPGIVKTVVHLLHQYDVNIERLDTEVTQAPISAVPLFNLKLIATVPESSPISEVKRELLDLAAEENLDLSFVK